MTELQRSVLTKFADRIEWSGNPASKWESLESDSPVLSAATDALVKLAYIVPVPTDRTADEFGGTRFRMTVAGWMTLGRIGPTAARVRG